MTSLALKLLAAGILAFLALAVVALLAPARHRHVHMAVAGLSALGAVLALLVLASGDSADFSVPLGLPGTGTGLRLDPLAALFLLVLFIPAGIGAVFALTNPVADRAFWTIPALIAFGMASLLAADVLLLLTAMFLGTLVVVIAPRDGAPRAIGFLCLLASFALLTASGSNSGFAALRATGAENFFVLLLGSLGVALLAGLPPLRASGQDDLQASAAALFHAGLRLVPVYLLIRLLMDLAGPALPVWWGVPPLVLGSMAALCGAYRAGQGAHLRGVLVAVTDLHLGLILVGIGVALLARGADLGPLATLALSAALLHALYQVVFVTLLLLGAEAVKQGAGTDGLDHCGGLIHAMPVTSLCLLAGAFAASFLPPAPAFASLWLLFQALFGAPRAGGLGLGILLAVIAAAIAIALTLGTAALLRLVGVVLLGRSRTPRVTAAQDAGRGTRGILLGLSVLALTLGVLPGLTLALIAPTARFLVGSDIVPPSGISLHSAGDASAYTALLVLILVLGAGGGIWLGLRAGSDVGERRSTSWNDGFAAPPPWLPLGDPATQGSASGYARALAEIFTDFKPAFPAIAAARTRLSQLSSLLRDASASRREWGQRHATMALFALLILLLILLAAR